MTELAAGGKVEVELNALLHVVLDVLAVDLGFATPREVDLPTLVPTAQVGPTVNVGGRVNLEAFADQGPALSKLVRRPGHFEVVDVDDQEQTQLGMKVA
jgi:hypothetical protein